MIRRVMEFEDENELIAAEQAIAMARELRQLADAAPDGHVLAVTEMAALERGRRFTRERLQDALNAQAAVLEKKGGAGGAAPVAGGGGATARPTGGSSPQPAMWRSGGPTSPVDGTVAMSIPWMNASESTAWSVPMRSD